MWLEESGRVKFLHGGPVFYKEVASWGMFLAGKLLTGKLLTGKASKMSVLMRIYTENLQREKLRTSEFDSVQDGAVAREKIAYPVSEDGKLN